MPGRGMRRILVRYGVSVLATGDFEAHVAGRTCHKLKGLAPVPKLLGVVHAEKVHAIGHRELEHVGLADFGLVGNSGALQVDEPAALVALP